MDTNLNNRRERRRMRTRDQLKQAAIDLLIEQGFDVMTVQDITDRADLGRGTFYIYFKDKQDILWKIIQEGIQAEAARAVQKLPDIWPDQLAYYGYLNTFHHAEQNRQLYRVMLGSQGSSVLTARVFEYMAEDTLNDMRKMDVYSEIGQPVEITAQIVVGAMIRLVIWWLETPNTYSAEDMAAMLYTALHHRPAPNPPASS
jgi:AcrR family transcriptional regulator